LVDRINFVKQKLAEEKLNLTKNRIGGKKNQKVRVKGLLVKKFAHK
jgi:hypothetical protein